MRRSLLLTFLVLLLPAVSVALDGTVQFLEKSEFLEVTSTLEFPWVVFFTATPGGSLLRDIKATAVKLKGVAFVAVVEDTHLRESYGSLKAPVARLFFPGMEEGAAIVPPLSPSAIYADVLRAVPAPDVVSLTSASFPEFSRRPLIKVVLVVGRAPVPPSLRTLAARYQRDFDFAVAPQPDRQLQSVLGVLSLPSLFVLSADPQGDLSVYLFEEGLPETAQAISSFSRDVAALVGRPPARTVPASTLASLQPKPKPQGAGEVEGEEEAAAFKGGAAPTKHVKRGASVDPPAPAPAVATSGKSPAAAASDGKSATSGKPPAAATGGGKAVTSGKSPAAAATSGKSGDGPTSELAPQIVVDNAGDPPFPVEYVEPLPQLKAGMDACPGGAGVCVIAVLSVVDSDTPLSSHEVRASDLHHVVFKSYAKRSFVPIPKAIPSLQRAAHEYKAEHGENALEMSWIDGDRYLSFAQAFAVDSPDLPVLVGIIADGADGWAYAVATAPFSKEGTKRFISALADRARGGRTTDVGRLTLRPLPSLPAVEEDALRGKERALRGTVSWIR